MKLNKLNLYKQKNLIIALNITFYSLAQCVTPILSSNFASTGVSAVQIQVTNHNSGALSYHYIYKVDGVVNSSIIISSPSHTFNLNSLGTNHIFEVYSNCIGGSSTTVTSNFSDIAEVIDVTTFDSKNTVSAQDYINSLIELCTNRNKSETIKIEFDGRSKYFKEDCFCDEFYPEIPNQLDEIDNLTELNKMVEYLMGGNPLGTFWNTLSDCNSIEQVNNAYKNNNTTETNLPLNIGIKNPLFQGESLFVNQVNIINKLTLINSIGMVIHEFDMNIQTEFKVPSNIHSGLYFLIVQKKSALPTEVIQLSIN